MINDSDFPFGDSNLPEIKINIPIGDEIVKGGNILPTFVAPTAPPPPNVEPSDD